MVNHFYRIILAWKSLDWFSLASCRGFQDIAAHTPTRNMSIRWLRDSRTSYDQIHVANHPYASVLYEPASLYIDPRTRRGQIQTCELACWIFREPSPSILSGLPEGAQITFRVSAQLIGSTLAVIDITDNRSHSRS